MLVFMTGASGYIGGVIAEKLLTEGHRIRALVQNEAAAERLRARGIETSGGGLQDAKALRAAAVECDGVIHAAFPRGVASLARAIEIERIAATAIVGALEGSHRPVVFLTGAGVVGDTGDRVLDEESSFTPDSAIGQRHESEKVVLAGAQYGVRSIVVRPSIVYGRGSSAGIVMLVHAARRAGVSRYIDAGESRHSMVHVDDLAELVRLALMRGTAGALYHASSHVVSFRELALALGRGQRFSPAAMSIPKNVASRVWPSGLVDAFSKNSQISSAQTQRQLGWVPRSPSVLEELERGSYTTGTE